MLKIKSGDEVIAIAGKDKGRRGKVLKVLPNKLVIEGLNMVKKHVKPNPRAGVQGGIVEKEMPIAVSNVMLYNPEAGKGDRVGFRFEGEQGSEKKVRYFKSSGARVDEV